MVPMIFIKVTLLYTFFHEKQFFTFHRHISFNSSKGRSGNGNRKRLIVTRRKLEFVSIGAGRYLISL